METLPRRTDLSRDASGLSNGPSVAKPVSGWRTGEWLGRWVDRYPRWFLFGVVLVTGLFCGWLNLQLYHHQVAFYDSVGYNENLFGYMYLAQQESIGAAMGEAAMGPNTVFLPYFLGILLSPFVEPSRLIGVAIQSLELFVFLISCFQYLQVIHRQRPTISVCYCLLLLPTAFLFREQGGLSDFRMDLSLVLLYSTSCFWALIALRTEKRSHYVICGASMGAACLFRATAPVFLIAALVPLALLALMRDRQRVRLTANLAICTGVTAILAGWFYVLNFEYLKYYYTIWNTDANAALSWWEAASHLLMVKRGIGDVQMVLLVVLFTLTLFFVRPFGLQCKVIRDNAMRSLPILWLAVVPLFILIGKGAGPNPFVSLLSVPPLLLFFYLSIGIESSGRWVGVGRERERVAWIAVVLGFILAGFLGWKSHSKTDFDRMSAHHQLIDAMVIESKNLNRSMASFATVHLTNLDTTSLFSTIQFDRPDAVPTDQSGLFEQVELKPNRLFLVASQSDWHSIRGNDVISKRQTLLRRAAREVDFLIVPTKESIPFVESLTVGKEINHHSEALRAAIDANPQWRKVAGPIQTDVAEWVHIFARTDLVSEMESASRSRRE